ncbi:MAG: ATP-binding protein [Candidatus Fermentibacteraceae bacterium]
MMEATYLERLIADQRSELLRKDPGIPRDLAWRDLLGLGRILAITGIRRCGKSTLLRQMAGEWERGFRYVNFDDVRLEGFAPDDYDLLLRIFAGAGQETLYLFDEIQMAPKWERYLRRLHDMGLNTVVTGSNSSLLSDELGAHLTGRHLRHELFPFSFEEFLQCRGVTGRGETTESVSEMLRASREYIFDGGFPEYVKHRRRELLEQTYRDIVARDIIARYGIRERRAFRELAHFAMSNPGCNMTYGKLARRFGFKSATSVKEYISYMEEVYLVFQLRRFDWSLKRSLLSSRKLYPVDNGLSGAVGFRPSPDMGRLLESAVFGHLRRFCESWYYRDQRGCDFVYEDGRGGYRCLQVCWHLQRENRERELGGIGEAMEFFGLDSGTLVTYDQEGGETIDGGRTVRIVPFWRWAMEEPVSGRGRR